MSIYKKLANIQQNLKVNKNHFNDFANFMYRSCEDILEAVKPLLVENELVLNITDEMVLVGDRFYIQATVKIIDFEGNFVDSKAYARESFEKPKMDSAQVTGSASSYARKYALNGLFCIDDEKDPDYYNNNEQVQTKGKASKKVQVPKKEQEKEESKQLVSDKQVAQIMIGCKKHNINIDVILEKYKIDNLEKLNIKQYETLMNRFRELDNELK